MQDRQVHHGMSDTLSPQALIEALLFYHGGTMSVSSLAKATQLSTSEVEKALVSLTEELKNRGVHLVREGTLVGLATHPQAETVIDALRREEREGPLGRAGLETLAIIMYRTEVSRADIEYIRGVNVSQVLRSLLMRGLVERFENPKDKRSFLYRITAEVPAYFGVSSISELPEFATIQGELQALLSDKAAMAEIKEEE